MSERQRKGFLLVNVVLLPLWLAMILAPRARATEWLLRTSTPLLAALSGVYTALLAAGMASVDAAGGPTSFGPDRLRHALATPQGFLTGWTHYVVLDFFLGRWIWQTALAERRRCRVALVCALMAGPLGFLVFSLQRRLAPADERDR